MFAEELQQMVQRLLASMVSPDAEPEKGAKLHFQPHVVAPYVVTDDDFHSSRP